MRVIGGQGRTLDPSEAELLARAEKWRPEITAIQLTVEKLRDLSQVEGLDFATAVLHDRILRIPGNAVFARNLGEMDKEGPRCVDLIGIVPGAFYRQHKHTGADGKRVAEVAGRLGIAAEVVPVKSFGSLAENAQLLAEWLLARRSKRVTLASLSKGSSDVKQALSRLDAEGCFRNVRAWVSLSGIVQGTPLVSWLRSRPLRYLGVRMLLRWHGHRSATLRELAWGKDGALSAWPTIPAGMRMVHVYGFPMRQHLRNSWAVRAYARLESLGPNDGGGVLLSDLAGLPGIVCPIWGADHYLSPSWNIESLLQAVVLTALDESDPLASRSEAQPSKAPATRSQV